MKPVVYSVHKVTDCCLTEWGLKSGRVSLFLPVQALAFKSARLGNRKVKASCGLVLPPDNSSRHAKACR